MIFTAMIEIREMWNQSKFLNFFWIANVCVRIFYWFLHANACNFVVGISLSWVWVSLKRWGPCILTSAVFIFQEKKKKKNIDSVTFTLSFSLSSSSHLIIKSFQSDISSMKIKNGTMNKGIIKVIDKCLFWPLLYF